MNCSSFLWKLNKKQRNLVGFFQNKYTEKDNLITAPRKLEEFCCFSFCKMTNANNIKKSQRKTLLSYLATEIVKKHNENILHSSQLTVIKTLKLICCRLAQDDDQNNESVGQKHRAIVSENSLVRNLTWNKNVFKLFFISLVWDFAVE